MRPLPPTPELRDLARRVLWFEEPERALARLAAYAMTYGTHEDLRIRRRALSDDELREALAQAPTGIFDGRSWAYWNLVPGRYPAPPMPERSFA